MLAEGAQVGSIAAIEAFQVALANYIDASKQALTMIDLETRRAVDWIRIDRAAYWKNEIRRAGDAVNRANDDLHKCLSFKSMEDYTPSCIDERKALQRAQERLRLAETKAEAVRHWSRAVQHELNEYSGRIVQFNSVLDGDIPKSLATLARIVEILNRYIHTTAPRPISESAIARPGGLNDPDAAVSTESMARPLDEALEAAIKNAAPSDGANDQSAANAEPLSQQPSESSVDNPETRP